MKISVAQIRPVKGDISANIAAHRKLIELAVSDEADMIFFSELSLTGYEPALAAELATNQDDQRLDDFQEISNEKGITIGIGAPTMGKSGTHISTIIFRPGKERQTYSKQILHDDELPFFVNGEKQVILEYGNTKIAPSICYESFQESHVDSAIQLGAEIYVASVAKSQDGIVRAMKHYPIVAKKFSVPVLMSNCVGYCDNFLSVGQTAVWTKEGILGGQLDRENEGILIFDTTTEQTSQRTI